MKIYYKNNVTFPAPELPSNYQTTSRKEDLVQDQYNRTIIPLSYSLEITRLQVLASEKKELYQTIFESSITQYKTSISNKIENT